MVKDTNMIALLYKTLAACQTQDDVAMLLTDLCTYREVEQMAQRVAAAKMLTEGKTYAEIIDETEISSATLSRVSKCVRYGNGGYGKFIPKE